MMLLLAVGCASTTTAGKSETYEARKRLARELIDRQSWPGAFFYADQLHREAPRDADVLVLRATVYRERGLPAEAEADLQEALRIEPRLPEAHAALGILYDVTGRGDAAEPHHRRAVEAAPENAGYLNNLGFSLFLRHKHRDAIDVYQKAVRLAPAARRIRTNLGFAYAASGDLPRARREFEMGGTPAEAKNNLGFAYEQRGDLGNAYSLYIEAVRLDPRLNHARANLIYVARKLGKEVPDDLPSADVPTPGDDAGRSKQ
jgi:Flp pilus assembly protein TadD